MCRHGDTVRLLLPSPDRTDPSGFRWGLRSWEIDRCIAPLVAALNAAGVITRGSCCGHGKGAGQIVLDDGRWLVVTTREAALEADLPHATPRGPAARARERDHTPDTSTLHPPTAQ